MNPTYRRGAPVLVVLLGLSVVGGAGLAWGSAAERAVHQTAIDARDRAVAAAASSSVAALPLPFPRSTYQVPVETTPAGAAVWEVDGDRRNLLCTTPCKLAVERERVDEMVVSLELGGYAPAKAHVRDVVEVPGGTLSLTFSAAPPPRDAFGSFAVHAQRGPTLRQGATQVEGKLPPEVIQRIVRQNFGRFRLCYENGLRENPALQGRVSVKFVIDRAGAVSVASDAGSDLPSANVVQCVVRGFGNLSFPQPDGAPVTVTYPILFSPGE